MKILKKVKRFFVPSVPTYFCIWRTGGEGTSRGSTHWDEFYRADTNKWVLNNELYSLWIRKDEADIIANRVGGDVIAKNYLERG